MPDTFCQCLRISDIFEKNSSFTARTAERLHARTADAAHSQTVAFRNLVLRLHAGRVVDEHRIGLTLYKILQIMDGDLDELIDALITTDRANKLAASEDNE